jgi:hypothetical protein
MIIAWNTAREVVDTMGSALEARSGTSYARRWHTRMSLTFLQTLALIDGRKQALPHLINPQACELSRRKKTTEAPIRFYSTCQTVL